MPISEDELAELLASNLSLKLKPEFRLSGARKEKGAIIARSEPAPRPELETASKGNGSAKNQNLRKLALAMSEDDLQQSVIDLAHLYGWRVAHFRSVKIQKKDGTTFWQTPVAADGEGFPDLVLGRDDPASGLGRILFVECKKEKEKPRPSQTDWLALLILTKRVEVYVFRPSDWLSGRIEQLLR